MELNPELEPQPQKKIEPQSRAWVIPKSEYSMEELEPEEEEDEEEEENENKALGYNRVGRGVDISDVPNEIYKSKTNRYYILFDDKEIPKNKEELVERTKIFEKRNVIIVNDENIEDIKDINNELSTNNLLFYPDFGYAITVLLDTQIELVQLHNNSFKIEREHLMRICDSEKSTKTLGDITITAVLNTNESPISADAGVGRGPKMSDSTSQEIYYRWTWGIDRVKANYSVLRGSDVNVAVLDTGFDLLHKGYKYRTIVPHNITGEDPQDYDGHGTHCIGIACGYEGEKQVRYGVAYNSNVYSCKVVDDDGIITQDSVQRGIKWALKNKCKVISISLEFEDRKILYNRAFEKAIRKALEENCLVVVAAGNDSQRKRRINSLGLPANLPSALAVSAIDKNNDIYIKSNQAGILQQMNFTAPGVDIYSSWSTTGRPAQPYNIMSGTSMATPYVAGLLALLWDLHSDDQTVTWDEILAELQNSCTKPNSNWLREDVGHGLPIAP